jgi:hypothetical protein
MRLCLFEDGVIKSRLGRENSKREELHWLSIQRALMDTEVEQFDCRRYRFLCFWTKTQSGISSSPN